MSHIRRISNNQPNMQTLVPRTLIGDRLREAFAQRWVKTDFSDLEHRIMASMTDEEIARMRQEMGL